MLKVRGPVWLLVYSLFAVACGGDPKEVTKKPAVVDKDDGKTGGTDETPTVTIKVTPATASLLAGKTQSFTAAVKGADDETVTWSVKESSGGTISAKGVYTAPDAAGTFHVVAASKADPKKTASATVAVRKVSIALDRNAALVFPSAGTQFTATVAGTTNLGVTWSIQEGAAGGSVAVDGTYTAPGLAGTYHIVATSVDDPRKTAVATVVVPVVVVPPSPAAGLPVVFMGATTTFTVSIYGSLDTTATWSVTETDGGTIDPSTGLYTAPVTPGTYHVVAVSNDDPSRSFTFTITIPPLTVTILPDPAQVIHGQSLQLTASVYGSYTTSVTWAVVGADAGSISATGLYTSPVTVGSYMVIAYSDFQPQVTASIVIAVTEVELGVSPSFATVFAGESVTFATFVTGAAGWNDVTWAATGGSISSTGDYTAPITPGTYTITATSAADPLKSASVTVTVPAITITVSGGTTVYAGESTTYTAGVQNSNLGYTWSVLEAGGGAISANGVYTASLIPGTYTIVATSNADGSVAGTISVTVPTITITPSTSSATVFATESLDLDATISNSNLGYTWSLVEANAGTIDQNGLYTAPITPGTYHVLIESVMDPATEVAVTITVPAIGVSFASASTTVFHNQSRQLTVSLTNSNGGVTWSLLSANGGTLSSTGLYTAPATYGTYTIKAASNADPAVFDTLDVVVPAVTVVISPASPTVIKGYTVQLSAAVTNTVDPRVTWTVVSGGGSVGANGLFTAPNSVGTVTVSATSVDDPSISDSVTITVDKAVLTVTPATRTVYATETYDFNASITGFTDQSMTWLVVGSGTGSVDSNGLYTAPMAAGTYVVVATSTFDNSVTGYTVVTVPDISVTVSPKTRFLYGTANTTFTGTASNSNLGVTWFMQGSNSGSVTSGGVYTAPITAGIYTVVAASTANPARQDTADITVPDIDVVTNKTAATVYAGATSTFTATVYQAVNTSVGWRVVGGAAGGTITAGGLYKAPITGGTYTVEAYSIADPTRAASITVTVPDIQVTINPTSVTVFATEQYNPFTATVALASNTSYSFSTNGGTINPQGRYTAPASAGTYTVWASSVLNPAYKAAATVTVPTVQVFVSPTSASMFTDTTRTFTATVTNSTRGVSWSVVTPNGGTITTGGLYRSPITAGTYVVRATSVAQPTVFADATVTVEQVTITISPTTATVLRGQTQSFTGTVVGTANTTVNYSVVTGGGGTISVAGVYTAPMAAGTYVVKATSAADTRQFATATVTVSPTVVGVSPASATINGGTTLAYAAFVTGATTTNVTWSVVEANGGTIDASGLYTAPNTSGTYTIRATSQFDNTTYGEAIVAVNGVLGPVTISPSSGCVVTGGLVAFTVSQGGYSGAFTWSVDGGAANGTITAGGLYTAPATQGTYTVRATGNGDATVTVSVYRSLDMRQRVWTTGANAIIDGDDVLTTTLRYKFQQAAVTTYTRYDQLPFVAAVASQDWFDFAAREVSKVTRYTASGGDATWDTADDFSGTGSFYALEYYGNLKQRRYALSSTWGTDQTWGTSDDVQGACYRWSVVAAGNGAGYPFDVTTYTPGADGTCFTGDDVSGVVDSHTYNASNQLIKVRQFKTTAKLTTNTQTNWIKTYTYTSGNLTTLNYYTNSGADNTWDTADDRFNTVYTYTYDGSNRVTSRLSTVYNPANGARRAANDLYVAYTYVGTAAYPSQAVQTNAGADNLIGNTADNVITGYTTSSTVCPLNP